MTPPPMEADKYPQYSKSKDTEQIYTSEVSINFVNIKQGPEDSFGSAILQRGKAEWNFRSSPFF